MNKEYKFLVKHCRSNVTESFPFTKIHNECFANVDQYDEEYIKLVMQDCVHAWNMQSNKLEYSLPIQRIN